MTSPPAPQRHDSLGRRCKGLCLGRCWDSGPGVPDAAVPPWDWACVSFACPSASCEPELQEDPGRAPAASKSSSRCLFSRYGVFPCRLREALGKKRMGSCWRWLREPRSRGSCPCRSGARQVAEAAVVPHGLAVRIPGFHPGSPGSTPGVGKAVVFCIEPVLGLPGMRKTGGVTCWSRSSAGCQGGQGRTWDKRREAEAPSWGQREGERREGFHFISAW